MAEALEDRRLLTCDVSSGIYLDGDVLCIKGTPEADVVSVELQIGSLANPSDDIVLVELAYDPAGFNNDVLISFQANVTEVDEIWFNGGGGNQSDNFTNDTHITSRVWGGGGVDNLYGGSGTDHFYGGDGDDNIYGNGGNDFLYGQDGNDDLYGGPGADYLYGGDSYDDLYGGRGADHLYGQDGPDTLNGGDLNNPNDGYVDHLHGDDSGSSDTDFFTPEIDVTVLDGDPYLVNKDEFADCSSWSDSVVGYDGDTENTLCDGESVPLDVLHLGPQDKTAETYDPVAELETPEVHPHDLVFEQEATEPEYNVVNVAPSGTSPVERDSSPRRTPREQPDDHPETEMESMIEEIAFSVR